MTQVVTEEQINDMTDEYVRGGKFSEYVDKACMAYRTKVIDELHKVTVYEYFKSVKNGCNKE